MCDKKLRILDHLYTNVWCCMLTSPVLAHRSFSYDPTLAQRMTTTPSILEKGNSPGFPWALGESPYIRFSPCMFSCACSLYLCISPNLPTVLHVFLLLTTLLGSYSQCFLNLIRLTANLRHVSLFISFTITLCFCNQFSEADNPASNVYVHTCAW